MNSLTRWTWVTPRFQAAVSDSINLRLIVGCLLTISKFILTYFAPKILTRNRNRKLLISRALTKAKSQEPAYSQALNQNKIDRQRSRSRESGRQTVRRLWWMVFGVETRR